MSLTKAAPEPGPDPLAPVGHLTGWLVATTLHVGLALLVGAIAARLLRSRHLHWSWAAAPLAPLGLARPVLGSSALALGSLAALSALIRGRRWHREDLDAGSDLAEIATRRLRPLDALHRLARRARQSGRNRADGWLVGEELILGHDWRGGAASIPFGRSRGGTHTLVVGSTGSGKTVTQTWMTVRAIEHGMGAIVVDPKGDPGLRAEVRRAAELRRRRLIEWTPEGPSVYNPYARGSDTEVADKVLAGERFTEPHYLRQAQRHLGHVVRVLRRLGVEVSLASIAHHLDTMRLECAARNLPEHEAEATYAYLDSLAPRQHADLAGVRDRLAILAESDVGPWLDPQTAGVVRFDLLGAVQDRAVVYFNLESDRRPLLTQMLGAAIVQDLQTTAASLQRRPAPALVVIDEFSAIAAEPVVRLFARARSAGLSLLLGTQELCDLRLPGRERLLEQVIGNLSALVAHRQVVPDSAELIASLAGTKGVWRTTRHAGHGVTRTRSRAKVLEPSELMSLQRGRAAVLVFGGGGSAQVADILSPAARR
jgi:TraM recognition site of TraD and TraG/Type IV secretion-system coupling protein DNA-binding domain